jgi:hypothetical protein
MFASFEQEGRKAFVTRIHCCDSRVGGRPANSTRRPTTAIIPRPFAQLVYFIQEDAIADCIHRLGVREEALDSDIGGASREQVLVAEDAREGAFASSDTLCGRVRKPQARLPAPCIGCPTVEVV